VIPTDTPIRAMVVDDDSSWLAILAELLSDQGLIVDQASSYDTAVKLIKAKPHRLAVVDLALSARDHHNQDGLRILEAVRLHDPGCHTVLLTGYATVELAVSALTYYGAFTCLQKEAFQRNNFRELVIEVLAASPSKPPIGEEISQKPVSKTTLTHKALLTGQNRTAIIVDDDAGWREILSELLVVSGYSVRQCSSFGEAIGYLGRERYDLAVIDLSLKSHSKKDGVAGAATGKELDGYRLLENARAAGLPTIVVSGVVAPADIERAYQDFYVFSCLEKQSFDRKVFSRSLIELQSIHRPTGEIELLTSRERQVLELLVKGMTNKEIADILVITPNTVKRHLKAVFEKLEVHTRAAAVAKAMNLGL